MTDEEYKKAAVQLFDLVDKAQTEEERKVAVGMLDDLGKMSSAAINAAVWPNPPKRKPRKKLITKIPLTNNEKYDKKNSRREAIMAQRERRV